MLDAKEAVDWDKYQDIELEEPSDEELAQQEAGQETPTEWQIDPQYANTYLSQLYEAVSKSIDNVFTGRQMYCGGKISRQYLESEKYVSLVTNLDSMEAALIFIDQAIDKENKERDEEELIEEQRDVQRNGSLLSSTERILAALWICRDAQVPQRLKPGILIMYFDLCEGLEFDYDAIAEFF